MDMCQRVVKLVTGKYHARDCQCVTCGITRLRMEKEPDSTLSVHEWARRLRVKFSGAAEIRPENAATRAASRRDAKRRRKAG